MADTTVSTANRVKQWSKDVFNEYIRKNRFTRYMGTDQNSIIHLKENLAKKKGDAITFQLLNRLEGAGRTGNQALEGYEEDITNDGHEIGVSYLRHAVVITLEEEQATDIDFLNEAKAGLQNWSRRKLRDHIITALMSINGHAYLSSQTAGNTSYTDVATETHKDAWAVANVDRVLFGAAIANYNVDHSAALLNIDNTADKLTPGMVSLAKRMAGVATPAITPVTVGDDEEWYVMFCSTQAFRDLSQNSTMTQANRDAMARGKDNPLFTGGDLMWDGVIIKEIKEIPVLTGVGNGAIDVNVNFLCGAQAVGIAWAKRTTPTVQTTDYHFRKGVGIMEMRGVEKLMFEDPGNVGSDVQHGVVTVYTAGVADS